MIPRHLRVTLLLLFAWALLVVFFLPGMRGRIARLARFTAPATEEQARRDVIRPVPEAAAGPIAKAKMFWADATGEELKAAEVELPLSTEPAERARQLLDALIARVPADAQRTLPADAAVLEVYVLQDGTAVIDFSSSVGASLPSGVRSEQLAIDSITQTLAANVPQIQRAKIVIQGLEADTLAGHLDLTGYFAVQPLQGAAPAPSQPKPDATGEKKLTPAETGPGAKAKSK